ncbi:hypothetical protein PQR62_13895 [Herbaspirillum lusitanum]|uniref:Uncharacterized protein n=1 Tax=Herbaspirillum lusitanum TaxID=213312 RepID=A0ABW9ABI9_9BURK
MASLPMRGVAQGFLSLAIRLALKALSLVGAILVKSGSEKYPPLARYGHRNIRFLRLIFGRKMLVQCALVSVRPA